MKLRRFVVIPLVLLLAVSLIVFSALSWQERNVSYLSYSLVNSLGNVEFDEVDEVLLPYLAESFWDVNLPDIKQDLENIPWVAKASISRSWPETLTIKLIEHQPFARWGEASLITQSGVIFKPDSVEKFSDLIYLDGDSLQAKTLLKVFNGLQGIFSTKDLNGWQIKKLAQQADGVLRVEFNSARYLIVEESSWQEKLERFLQAYPKLPKKLVKSAQSFDLRYSNGLAIKPAKSPLVQEVH